MGLLRTEFASTEYAPALYDVVEAACICDHRKPIPKNRYPAPTLGFVLAGCFDYRTESGLVVAVPGSVLFGNLGEWFSCRHGTTAGNKCLVVTLPKRLLEEAAKAYQLDDARFHAVALPPNGAAAVIFGKMRKLAMRREDKEDDVYVLAATALRASREHLAPTRATLRDRERILSVVRYVDSSYAELCSLTILAYIAGISRFHFVRLFKEVIGQTPNQYVINTRMRAAANRLLDTKMPIAAIAQDVGFGDISHFNACFRSHFGCAPRRWRQSIN